MMRFYLHRLERCMFTGALIAVVQLAVISGNKTTRASLAASAHTTQAKALAIVATETAVVAGLIIFVVTTIASVVIQRVRERRWHGR